MPHHRIAAALERLSLRGGEAGELAPLPPEPEYVGLVRTNIIAQVSSGTMPQGGKMDAADRLKLISGLTSAPAEAAAMPKAK